MRGAAALLVLAACTNDVRVGAPLRRVLDVPPDRPTALDVLFVVDPSSTTSDERAQMIAAAGDAVFGELERRLGALPDLHVGVISSEVAVGGLPIGCDGLHDGELRTGAGTCANVPGHYLIDTLNADGSRLHNYSGALADAFACLADLPASTCEVAQPIAAVRDALLPGAPAANAGFLREYAMLLVVFVAPRDDCSSTQLSFYSPGEFGNTPLDSRCFAQSSLCDGAGHCAARSDGQLLAIPDVADELRGLKRDPSMVMIAGVFAAPDHVTLDQRGPDDVVADRACTNVDARPALRLAALAGEFPSRYAYASMCDGDPAAQLRAVTDVVAGVLGGSHCLLGPLPDHAPCRAYAETDAARAPIPICAQSFGGNCFQLARTDACAATESQLAATPTSAPKDAHFVVECEAPPGL